MAATCCSWCLCWGSSSVADNMRLEKLVLPVFFLPLMVLTLPHKPCTGDPAVVLRVYEWARSSFGLSFLPNCHITTWEEKFTMWLHEEQYRDREQHVCWCSVYLCLVYCSRHQDYSFLANVPFFPHPYPLVFQLPLIPIDCNRKEFCPSCV